MSEGQILNNNKRVKTVSTLMVLLAGTAWGSIGFFARALNNAGISSLASVEVRLLGTAIVVWLYALIFDRDLIKIKLKDLWIFLGVGLIGNAFFNICYFSTIELTSLSVAAILLYTAPIFVMVMSLFIFKEKMTPLKILCLISTFVGCIFVSGVIGDAPPLTPSGILVGICAGFGYALYTIFSKLAINRGYRGMTVVMYTFMLSSITVGLMVDVKEIVVTIATGGFELIIMALGCIFIGTVIPNTLYVMGLRNIENGKAAIMSSVEPVVATILGVIAYNERLTVSGTIGIVLVIGALVILNLFNKEE